MKILLVGLTISFAPPAFAQQNDAVDAETAKQVRALASIYDAAFNRQDAVTIAGLYAENAAFNTPEGTFHGRQAIEELYAKHYFGEAHSKNVVTVVNEAIAAGNQVRATGTWSEYVRSAVRRYAEIVQRKSARLVSPVSPS